jgi:hypothetical protein
MPLAEASIMAGAAARTADEQSYSWAIRSIVLFDSWFGSMLSF